MTEDEVAYDTMSKLSEHVKCCGAVVMTYVGDHFAVGSEWGEEEPGSPMAGGAAYGTNETLELALIEMLRHHD
jgi:hypothetical protein